MKEDRESFADAGTNPLAGCGFVPDFSQNVVDGIGNVGQGVGQRPVQIKNHPGKISPAVAVHRASSADLKHAAHFSGNALLKAMAGGLFLDGAK